MINENNKVFFIVNRYSGTGFNPKMEKLVQDTCLHHRVDCQVAYTEGPGHATTLARGAMADGFDRIVAVGGDGTVNEVGQALAGMPSVMGILPKGSGNGLARHLGVPLRFDAALRSLFSSEVLAIDTLRINGRLSLNVSGIGFDGFIADCFGRVKHRGFKGYFRLVMNEFRRFREFDVLIEANGQQIKKTAFVIAIANSSQYGNNARIAPAASVRDQLLDLSILQKFPFYRIDLVLAFFAGTIDRANCCRTWQVRKATVTLSDDMFYHIDGEPAGKARQFTIELIPASLNMLVPQGTKC